VQCTSILAGPFSKVHKSLCYPGPTSGPAGLSFANEAATRISLGTWHTCCTVTCIADARTDLRQDQSAKQELTMTALFIAVDSLACLFLHLEQEGVQSCGQDGGDPAVRVRYTVKTQSDIYYAKEISNKCCIPRSHFQGSSAGVQAESSPRWPLAHFGC
jgi:hypothetical protein